MPKFYGKIGYALPVENPPGSGIWGTSFSIVADEYAYAYFHLIKYIEYNGVKWVVQTVDASQPPRLTLEVGGVYNE